MSGTACLAKLPDGLIDFLQADALEGFKVRLVFGRTVYGSPDRVRRGVTMTGIKKVTFRLLRIYTTCVEAGTFFLQAVTLAVKNLHNP